MRHSPHVLDLRKEMAEKKEKEIFEKRNKVEKILNSSKVKIKKLNKKIFKLLSAIKNNFKNIKNFISSAGLELNFSKNKIRSDVFRLFAAKRENIHSASLGRAATRKHENEDVAVSPMGGVGGFDGLKENQKIKKPRIYKIIPKLESSQIITPFYLFRFKNALANLLLFLLFISILVLPVKGFIYAQKMAGVKIKIIDRAASAAGYLKEAKNSVADADIESIKNQFNKASSEFILAREEADEIDSFTKTLIKIIPNIGGSFKSGENVLIMGEYLAKSGQYFTEIADILQNNIGAAQLPSDKLEVVKNNLSLSLLQLQKATSAGGQINIENIPSQYQEEISKIKNYLPEITEKIKNLIHYIEVFQKILGRDEIKRYLFIFQNNNEIRASGGFAGSYALVDISNGKIENLEIPSGGSYDLEGGETKNIIAPEPLQLINGSWHFWDANWFFDFPTTAEKLIEFYNNSGGPTVDGVIAINGSMMQEIVGAVGEIEVPGFDQAVNGENFIQLLQEEGYKHKFEKEPKKFLSAAGPEIIKKLINQPENLLNILPVLSKGLAQKDLQFYFSSYNLEREIMDLGWSGRILETNKDYLAAVHTNIGGGKTDQVIKNKIWHNAEILENGEVVNTLIITRFHQGQKGDPFTGIANNDYLRIYVPLGSKLISAYGFSEMPSEAFEIPEEGYEKDEIMAEIEEQTETDRLSGTKIFIESNKTVFGNWIHLKPGESKSVYLKYRLPFTISKSGPSEEEQTIWEQVGFAINPKTQPLIANVSDLSYYSLLLQKQSGINDTIFTSRVKSLFGNKVSWSYPDDWQSDGNIQTRSFVLDRDMMEAAVFE
ncbi:MAG: DUF4012 domain-containing protein [bacterium]